MRLSRQEQQILDDIQQGVQAEDPAFFTSMVGSPSRRGGFVWGWLTFLSGLVVFMVGAVLAAVVPGWGVVVSLVGFLAMFWGGWLLCSGGVVFRQHGQEGVLRQWLGRLWDSMNDPSPPGMSL